MFCLGEIIRCFSVSNFFFSSLWMGLCVMLVLRSSATYNWSANVLDDSQGLNRETN